MIGDKVKRLRDSKNLTQQELADSINLSQSTIGMIESGKKIGSPATLKKIADFFEVTVDYLLSTEDKLEMATDSMKRIHDMAQDALNDNGFNKIDKLVKENKIETLAAHFENEEFTDDDVEDIRKFIEYVATKRKNNN
ncbi:helix-turn-helix domain-containing protein [Clostridium cadaveris]|uniref:XRE family transcriptional regulator n=1 Tax=Clostridium cadaveris TaxID=1529 RepID=A0A316MQC7_9CLOT|nr:helix-turn-helix domain-containing protein [Clostridium cadaveris]NWK12622.1 helix-turn-helix transcriptional regulator [Clostridium cadaveris]PWL54600.1 MAG: XRE family transcriptional regulator [Clostridium cadaveris]